jgi:predicted Zn-dependent protease
MTDEEKAVRRAAAEKLREDIAEKNRVVDEAYLAELEKDFAEAERALDGLMEEKYEIAGFPAFPGSVPTRRKRVADAHERLLRARAKLVQQQREQGEQLAAETLKANVTMAEASREAARSSVEAAKASKRAAFWTLVAAVVAAIGVAIQAWAATRASEPSAASPPPVAGAVDL